jgi:hypothetical protein
MLEAIERAVREGTGPEQLRARELLSLAEPPSWR